MNNAIPTNELVTDTMALILRLEKRKLGKVAKSWFESAEVGETQIYIPSLVFAEILYLGEKGRITVSFEEVGYYLKQYPNFQESPINFAVIQMAATIKDIRELHDRLIAATALSLNLPLITNDPVIESSAFIKTVW